MLAFSTMNFDKIRLVCLSCTMGALCLISVGCGVSQDEYAQKAAETACEYTAKCLRESLGGDVGDGKGADILQGALDGVLKDDECVESTAKELRTVIDQCKDWDSQLARKCLKAQGDMECPSAEGEADDIEEPESCAELVEICGVVVEEEKEDPKEDAKKHSFDLFDRVWDAAYKALDKN